VEVLWGGGRVAFLLEGRLTFWQPGQYEKTVGNQGTGRRREATFGWERKKNHRKREGNETSRDNTTKGGRKGKIWESHQKKVAL